MLCDVAEPACVCAEVTLVKWEWDRLYFSFHLCEFGSYLGAVCSSSIAISMPCWSIRFFLSHSSWHAMTLMGGFVVLGPGPRRLCRRQRQLFGCRVYFFLLWFVETWCITSIKNHIEINTRTHTSRTNRTNTCEIGFETFFFSLGAYFFYFFYRLTNSKTENVFVGRFDVTCEWGAWTL